MMILFIFWFWPLLGGWIAGRWLLRRQYEFQEHLACIQAKYQADYDSWVRWFGKVSDDELLEWIYEQQLDGLLYRPAGNRGFYCENRFWADVFDAAVAERERRQLPSTSDRAWNRHLELKAAWAQEEEERNRKYLAALAEQTAAEEQARRQREAAYAQLRAQRRAKLAAFVRRTWWIGLLFLVSIVGIIWLLVAGGIR